MNILNKINSRALLNEWFSKNHLTAIECWLFVKIGNPADIKQQLTYLDAVEIALCYGWIDSVVKKINNQTYRRFTPRKKNSHWTELNKERVRRLIKTGEMTEYGLKVCPDLNQTFKIPTAIINEFKKNAKAYNFFIQTPLLYQKIKIDNLKHYLSLKQKKSYRTSLKKLIEQCEQNKLYGNWNDYGRLS